MTESIKSFLDDGDFVAGIFIDLEIECGVPQLFLFFINDLTFSLKHATPSHFADDTSIIYASKTPKTIETNLNYDLKCVSEWLRSNRLSPNVGKN